MPPVLTAAIETTHRVIRCHVYVRISQDRTAAHLDRDRTERPLHPARPRQRVWRTTSECGGTVRVSWPSSAVTWPEGVGKPSASTEVGPSVYW